MLIPLLHCAKSIQVQIGLGKPLLQSCCIEVDSANLTLKQDATLVLQNLVAFGLDEPVSKAIISLTTTESYLVVLLIDLNPCDVVQGWVILFTKKFSLLVSEVSYTKLRNL